MKTYHIVTIGCQMNRSDSERIAGYLEDLEYVWIDNREKADLVVVTTCGIRQSAEDRIYGLIPRVKKKNPKSKIILTGCLVGREDIKKRLKKSVDIWMSINELPELAEKLGLDKQGSLSGYLSLAPKYDSSFSAFVPIGNGCNNFCSYCVVPYARGREVYRAAEEIVTEVKSLIQKGFTEITLIAQNVNSYHSGDGDKIDFADLLKMVNDIPGEFWLRFSTSHPKDMSEKLINAVANLDKVCEHFHLPAQAGDDQILERMNRKYTRSHYLELINKIRKSMPQAGITTDVIVGFPGETEEQFGRTIDLFKQAKFDMAYVSQYSPRPGTAAAKLEDDITPSEKRKREDFLIKIMRQELNGNGKKYSGRTRVLIEGRRGDLYIARTRSARVVKIKSKKTGLVGKFVEVELCDNGQSGLTGTLIK